MLRVFQISLIAAVFSAKFYLPIGSSSAVAEPAIAIGFSRDIQPLLSDNCYQCHGPDEGTREADLRLDTEKGLATIDKAELLRRINSDAPDEVMPPPETKRSLNESQKQSLHDWVQAGAVWEGHWAFEKPTRPALPVPGVADRAWARNAIDLFISGKLKTEGVAPSKPASPAQRLRRVTLELTGLPPTLAELDSFEANKSPDAWSEVVERLLASPHFGERMSMEWLDAARYADTNGYQGDRERTMWPWRDWVIDAINRNQPYNEFTVWQLAGDLLPNATEEQKLATGFCRNHMINGEGGRIAEENRVEYVFDQIETLGTVWMGMTVQCCRCHDHKFDPIKQSEYYKLFAFFNQTPINGGGGDPQMAPNMLIPSSDQSEQIAKLQTELESAAASLQLTEEALTCDTEEIASLFKKSPNDRSGDEWKKLEDHFARSKPEFVSVSKSWREANEAYKRERNGVPKVMIMQDVASDKKRKTFILSKGLYNQKLDEVTAGTPGFLPPMSQENPDRLGIASWLVSPDHPLTARVTVNRIWQMFFGAGLVKSAEDFGVQGEKPSHPKLLDWLASELVDSGWDTKHIIRLIANSATYQQSATVTPEMAERDPENRLLARGPRRRMPAWMIRDHTLAVSGVLNARFGGPSVKPYQPEGIWAEASFGNKKYKQDHGANLYRRSLYVYWRRIVGPTMFFDMPKRQTCSVRAGMTNTPLHALVTLNDTTYVEAARIMATRVLRATDERDARISYAFRLATSRRPRGEEVQLLAMRLEQLTPHYTSDEAAAKQLLGVGEMPLDSEFESAERAGELAAWTTICLMVTNLDEALNK